MSQNIQKIENKKSQRKVKKKSPKRQKIVVEIVSYNYIKSDFPIVRSHLIKAT